uniref:Probable 3-oxoacyl-[acyl-carrier-protein] reductase oxidoreductase (EC) n=1 Tax=Ganoderma boninense TaxID=34458 RepID=A0A5K1JX87_9APHY|nr:Probable 3-oxoacyl-[acyl-carrier-protein] reductase oxidoreductase (EC [Ganoderma boninense]
MPSHSSHPPTRGQGIGRSSYAELPVKPAVPAPETLKRMIGIPDDKGNFGHFDLTMPHLEPPPPAKVAPPIPAHTIVLAQIPKKFRNAQFVRPWAKRYGNALRVSIDIKVGKALVEWGSLAAAEAAFTSMRLRGDGKEHIRAYRYIGVKGARFRPKEIEEGEIEEGEVTEVVETKAKKKKKNKGKTKAQPEQRFPLPVSSVPAPVRAPLPVRPPPPVPTPAPPPPLPTHESLPRLPPGPAKDTTVPTPSDVAAIIAAATALRPVLEKISQPPPPVPPKTEAEEEAMELDSDGEEEKAPSPPVPSTTSAVTSEGQVEVKVEFVKVESEDGGIVEEDMEVDVEDEDMEMSSPIQGPHVPLVPERSPPPRPPRPSEADSTPTPAHPAPPPPADDDAVQAGQVVKDARRRKLEEAIARTKAQLALRENALSSRPTLMSSSGSSESPEPPTPVDSPHIGGVDVDVASASGDAIVVDSDPVEEADVVVKTESTAVTLDDLAVSFITESIQTVSASSSSSTPPQPSTTSSTTMLASVQLLPPRPMHRPNAIPIVAPVPTSNVAMMQPPPARIPLTDEQKQAKQKKWLELVAGSSSLIDKIAAAKNKEEKSLLMRMLKSKTKAADALKREIDSGFALAVTPSTTPSTSASSSSSSLSATPTPVPFSRTPSVTPVPTPSGTPIPTPTPGSNGSQKRRTSPPTGTAMSISMFRWPETAREMIIIVSDDEAD